MPGEWNKFGIASIILSLFLLSFVPLINGSSINLNNTILLNKHANEDYDIYLRDAYDSSDLLTNNQYINGASLTDTPFIEVSTISEASARGRSGLMDSAWPMFCHDVYHTGRSSYSTVNVTGVVKWRISTTGPAYGGPAIDNNGTIYIGSFDLNAVYSNGTLKWKFPVGWIITTPAIADDGTIYFGTITSSSLLRALNPNGTLKWTYPMGDQVFSSPVIGNDGTIYIGSADNAIHAVYPNGTRKWVFNTDHVVYSSPAIGLDGTIYCGCHDTYLYALNPENGTLKWKFKTGDWIRTSPCVADDGTIYVVSLDGYIYAVDPNGTMKWRTNCGAGTSPTIAWDGTIYCGCYDLYALNPENGSVKWIYDAPGTLEGATPCNSIDGTIYLGTYEGGLIIAVNSDGTEQWRRSIGCTDSAPAIGPDGTVYIGSEGKYLFAFGKGPLNVEANGPYTGYAHELIQFTGTIYGGSLPYSYIWDFGDDITSTEQNPKHTYNYHGNYTVTFTVTDAEGNSSSDTATVFVDYALPMVSIVKPANALYILNIPLIPLKEPVIIGRITLDVDASQEDGFDITHINIYIDDDFQTAVSSEPFTWIWKGFSFGEHHIDVCAYDSKGHTNWATLYVMKFF